MLESVHGLIQVCGRNNVVAFQLQPIGEKFAAGRIVLDHKNAVRQEFFDDCLQ
jgi:hypothetical protein